MIQPGVGAIAENSAAGGEVLVTGTAAIVAGAELLASGEATETVDMMPAIAAGALLALDVSVDLLLTGRIRAQAALWFFRALQLESSAAIAAGATVRPETTADCLVRADVPAGAGVSPAVAVDLLSGAAILASATLAATAETGPSARADVAAEAAVVPVASTVEPTSIPYDRQVFVQSRSW